MFPRLCFSPKGKLLHPCSPSTQSGLTAEKLLIQYKRRKEQHRTVKRAKHRNATKLGRPSGNPWH